jgi:hypothetical protein
VKKPFIEGQQAYQAGAKRGANPFRGYDEAAQELQWDQGWLLAKALDEQNQFEKWCKEFAAELKFLHKDYKQNAPAGKNVRYADFCRITFDDKVSRRLVKQFRATGGVGK